ncbi:hypothetical protein B0J18DRAFT_975 [Chaetomium sp. MPI-SDFR-AT-0129]|nr:hypothetical protein B0J18DRAFT_975 [Chaetomium sp. MPI-SDFR-AT-0129]
MPSERTSFFSRLRPSPDASETAPPAYTAEDNTTQPPGAQGGPSNATDLEAEAANLTAAFDNLSLSNTPGDPTVDSCLAHLKLLFAIQWMKEDVGFSDGLWGLWDSNAGPIDPILKARPEKEKAREKKDEKGGEEAQEPSVEEKLRNKNLEMLSKIREKRWALFVARAVDRYEAWWEALKKMTDAVPLCEADMVSRESLTYAGFPSNPSPFFKWQESMLPPLDVLMVWHTHMLNPRAFLEDAILAGMRDFWAIGLPWDLVNKAIDTDFNYNVSPECKSFWSGMTGRAWENPNDPMSKTIRCPRCSTDVEVPWTTCEVPENRISEIFDNYSGQGYGDSQFSFPCTKCSVCLRKELLAVDKFIRDHKLLLGPSNRPMPGTILDPKTGRPTAPPPARMPHTFPNRMLKSGCAAIRSTITSIVTSRSNWNPSMEDVRQAIDAALAEKDSAKTIDKMTTGGRYRLPAASRVAVRKMMSRYWENCSMFALDLSGAVMRQGVFVEKMCQLDWLHSPSARDTMARLLVKYRRFMGILTERPGNIAVPTLDVDLAWHTHQLDPTRYYAFTVNRGGRFIDHDDKIAENTLSEQFEWTSKVYQELYGEVYSECTCWYCESIRSSLVSSVGRALGVSKQGKVAETFHKSGAASLHPPSSSAHISAHPAVLPRTRGFVNALDPDAVTAGLNASHNRKLDMAYRKARDRAKKKGREPPRREEVYYDHWGYPYLYAAPYAYPLWWTPGLYYGWYPGYVAACATGAYGGCCNGTCGGGVAAGACGGAGGCGGAGAGGDGVGGGCSGKRSPTSLMR